MGTLIYIGDPMCSWCWGIVPQLEQVVDFWQERQLDFKIKVGGLRPGGGDPWDQKMKDFLKHHWDQVREVSGQPFSYQLLKHSNFNYDTEPACRLVVAARRWLGPGNLKWFKQLQELFYVNSLELSDLSNIDPLCKNFNIDPKLFREHFQAAETVEATVKDFNETRNWGIHGYPTLVIRDRKQLTGISNGYSTFPTIKARLEHYLSTHPSV